MTGFAFASPGMMATLMTSRLRTITEGERSMGRKLPPHPGEVLREEFIKPLGLSANAGARGCHVPRRRIHLLVHEASGITADTALRLAKLFDTTPDFWMNLQDQYELET